MRYLSSLIVIVGVCGLPWFFSPMMVFYVNIWCHLLYLGSALLFSVYFFHHAFETRLWPSTISAKLVSEHGRSIRWHVQAHRSQLLSMEVEDEELNWVLVFRKLVRLQYQAGSGPEEWGSERNVGNHDKRRRTAAHHRGE